jgi:acetyltransferase
MKIDSPDIVHKTDVDGVRLNIDDAHWVRKSYQDLIDSVTSKNPEAKIAGVIIEPMHSTPHGRELFIGVTRDEVFGPVISIGAGGTHIELLKDKVVALPPLNTLMADAMVEKTRIYKLLQAYRNMPAANIKAIGQVLRRISEMICEIPQIEELEINPLVVDEHGVMTLDTRVRVQARPPAWRRYAHMAIHPYPSHMCSQYQLPDGTDIVIRPIRPEDAKIEDTFVRNLSKEAKYFRFMHALKELTTDMLIRFTQIDYDREMAFIAVAKTNSQDQEVGVARYVINADGNSCEFAIVVDDHWQGKGIGSHLLTALIEAARVRGIQRMTGEVLTNNKKMLELLRHLEFNISTDESDPSIKLVYKAL